MTAYSLKVINNSTIAQTVGIFQTNPNDNALNGLPIIFSSHSINPNGGTGLFVWQLNWGLSWGSGPTSLANGVTYTATGSNILRDPSQTNQNNAVVTYTDNNSWSIVGNDKITVAGNLTTQTASNFTNKIAVDNNFTLNVTLTSDILGTTPIFAMNGLPNNDYTFAIQPTYYVSTIYNKASVAVLGSAINGSGKIVFANNNNNMEISLNDQNQWSSASPAAAVVGLAKSKPVGVTDDYKKDVDKPSFKSIPNLVIPSFMVRNSNVGTSKDGVEVSSYGQGQLSGVVYTIPAHGQIDIDISIELLCITPKDVETLNNMVLGMLKGSQKSKYEKLSQKSGSGGISFFWFLSGGVKSSYSETTKNMKSYGLTDTQLNQIITAMVETMNDTNKFVYKGTIYNKDYDYSVSGSLFAIVMDAAINQGSTHNQSRYIASKTHLNGSGGETLPVVGKLY